MAKDWDYAQLTKRASEFGGPEKLMAAVKEEAYNNGAAAMKDEMTPLLFVAVVVGATGMYVIQRGRQWLINHQEKKKLAARRAEEAEAILIQKMHEAAENDHEKDQKDSSDQL